MKKLIFIFLLIPFLSHAGEVSGFISLKWKNGTTYQVTVTTYSTSPVTDSLQLNFGDGTSNWFHFANGSGDTVCDSLIMNTYTIIHSYPGSATYRLSILCGNRTANINNIPNSGTQQLYLYHTLTISPLTGNSITSPRINNPPMCSYGCPSQCYNFNLNATDSIAGDSLSYSIGSCADSAYSLPANVTIDPVTGTLTWCNPDSTGLFNFSIRIITYRSVVVGSNTEHFAVDTTDVDLQVNVQANCPTGINEVNKTVIATLYPNPNKGAFTLQVGSGQLAVNSKVEIYNALGQKVYSTQLSIVNHSLSINIGAQPSGIYLYRILNTNGKQIDTGKFIINK